MKILWLVKTMSHKPARPGPDAPKPAPSVVAKAAKTLSDFDKAMAGLMGDVSTLSASIGADLLRMEFISVEEARAMSGIDGREVGQTKDFAYLVDNPPGSFCAYCERQNPKSFVICVGCGAPL